MADLVSPDLGNRAVADDVVVDVAVVVISCQVWDQQWEVVWWVWTLEQVV